MPYIGKHSLYNNVIIAGGHAMLGISEATGTAKIVTNIIEEKPQPFDILPFSVERF